MKKSIILAICLALVPAFGQTQSLPSPTFNNGTFTGTVTGISKGMVGLGNVDNTSDAAKPVSTAASAAIAAAINGAVLDLSKVGVAPGNTAAANTSAVNNAITALGAGCGQLLFPLGTIQITTINVVSGCTYSARARGTTTLTSANASLFTATGTVSKVIFENLTIKSTATGAGLPGLIYIDNQTVDGLEVRYCDFDSGNQYNDAVFVKNPSGLTLKNVNIHHNRVSNNAGLSFEIINHDNTTYTSTNVSVDDNVIATNTSSSAGYGVSLSGRILGGSVSRNRITGGGGTAVGIELAAGISSVVVQGNVFYGTFGSVISVSDPNSTYEASGLVINGNVAGNATNRVTGAISISWGGAGVMSNNVFYLQSAGGVGGGNAGIAMASFNTYKWRLTDNIVDTTGSVALDFYQTTYNVVSGGKYTTNGSGQSCIRNETGTGINYIVQPPELNFSSGVAYDGSPMSITSGYTSNGVLYQVPQADVQSIAYSATVTPVWVDGSGKQKAIGALTGAITVANPATIPPAGTRVSVAFLQDGTGGRAVSWGTSYKFPTAWSNTSNTAGTRSLARFESDGTYLWAAGANTWN